MPDHFTAVAARYAAYRPHYPAALVELLGHGELAWDVGTGNGQLAVALAAHYSRVIATDLSQRQLDAAVSHPRVEYRCAPAEASGLADASADLVVAAQAAHWFDWPRYLAEVGRVARPGALVALVSYGNAILEGAAGDELRDFHRRVVGPYWPAGREHVENGYRDLDLPWTPVTPPAIDMTAEWTRDELAGYVSSWSATSRHVAANGPAEFEAFCARLAASWPGDERRQIRWPLTIKLARR
jgi:SAM-dependent methyltransferase